MSGPLVTNKCQTVKEGTDPSRAHIPTVSLNCCQLIRECLRQNCHAPSRASLVVPLLPELLLVGLLQLLLSLPELGQDEGDDVPRLLDLLLIHLDLELLLVGNGDHPVMMFNIRIAQT